MNQHYKIIMGRGKQRKLMNKTFRKLSTAKEHKEHMKKIKKLLMTEGSRLYSSKKRALWAREHYHNPVIIKKRRK